MSDRPHRSAAPYLTPDGRPASSTPPSDPALAPTIQGKENPLTSSSQPVRTPSMNAVGVSWNLKQKIAAGVVLVLLALFFGAAAAFLK